MGPGEVLDATFRVFRRAWKPLLLVGLAGAVPALVAAVINYRSTDWGPVLRLFGPRSGVPLAGNPAAAVPAVFTSMISLATVLVYLLVQATVTALCADLVMNRSPALGTALSTGTWRYSSLLGTALLLALPIGLVLMAVNRTVTAMAGGLSPPLTRLITLLVTAVAGAILRIFVVFVGQTVVLEGLSGWAACRRSLSLVHRRFWSVLGAAAVLTAMTELAGGLFGLLVSIPLGAAAVMTGNAGFLNLSGVVNRLPLVATTPFYLVGMTLIYYETRARKEGLDLDLLARQRAGAAPP